MSKQPFNPFDNLKTVGGWPARLVGVVKHKKYPLVVAVFNPAFDQEEVYFYAEDGQSFTKREYADGTPDSVHTGHFQLESTGPWVDVTADKLERTTKVEDFVEPSIEHLGFMDVALTSNPFHYDHFSMGTDVVRGYTVLHEGYDRKEHPEPLLSFDIYNGRNGQVFRVHLKQKMTEERKKQLTPMPAF